MILLVEGLQRQQGIRNNIGNEATGGTEINKHIYGTDVSEVQN